MHTVNMFRLTDTQEGKFKIKTCPFCIPRPFFEAVWDSCGDVLVIMLISTYSTVDSVYVSKMQPGPFSNEDQSLCDINLRA